jgi:hypothetical protein
VVITSDFIVPSRGCEEDSFLVVGLVSVSSARQAQPHTRGTDEALYWALSPLVREVSEEAEQVHLTRNIIHRCITPSDEESGSPFALWERR